MGKIAGDPTSRAPSLRVWGLTRCCVGHPRGWVVQGWLTGQLHGVPPRGVNQSQQGTCHRVPAGLLACSVGLSCSTGTSARRRGVASTSFFANGGLALGLGRGPGLPRKVGRLGARSERRAVSVSFLIAKVALRTAFFPLTRTKRLPRQALRPPFCVSCGL